MLLKKILVIYLILIAVFSMAGACVETGGNTDSSQENSLISDITQERQSDSNNAGRVFLETAIENYLAAVNPPGEIIEGVTETLNTGGITPEIYQIIGFGVDREGKADTWAFGIRYAVNNSMIYYGNSGWREAVWPGKLPDEKINTDSILKPSEIISHNSESASAVFEKSKNSKITLVLSEGIYSLTPENSGDAKGVKISAYTGEVIQ